MILHIVYSGVPWTFYNIKPESIKDMLKRYELAWIEL